MLAVSHRQKLHLQIRWLLCLVQLLEVLQVPQACQHLLRARAEAKSLGGMQLGCQGTCWERVRCLFPSESPQEMKVFLWFGKGSNGHTSKWYMICDILFGWIRSLIFLLPLHKIEGVQTGRQKMIVLNVSIDCFFRKITDFFAMPKMKVLLFLPFFCQATVRASKPSKQCWCSKAWPWHSLSKNRFVFATVFGATRNNTLNRVKTTVNHVGPRKQWSPWSTMIKPC